MNDKFDAWLLIKVWWICVMDHLFHMFNFFVLRGPNLSLVPFGVAYICPCLVDDKCNLRGIQQACKQVYDFTRVLGMRRMF